MFSIVLFIVGLVIGLAASPVVVPLLAKRFPALARSVASLPAALPIQTMQAKVEAAIAELESQIANRVDVERNATRLAQLRELIEG